MLFPTVETKDSVMIHGQNLFDYPVKDDLRTYDNVQKLQLVKMMISDMVKHELRVMVSKLWGRSYEWKP